MTRVNAHVPKAWTIRRAGADDARRIAEITVAGWRHTYPGILPDAVLAGLDVDALTTHRTEQLAGGTAMFVASQEKDEAGVRGFVIVGPVQGPPGADDEARATGMLTTLYLDPPVIGTGAGSALHDAAVAHLAEVGYRRAVLWAFAGNTDALAFYARRGWSLERGPVQPDGWEAPCVRYEKDLLTRA